MDFLITFFLSLRVLSIIQGKFACGGKTMEQLRKMTDEQLRMIFAASCIKAAAGHILTII